MCVSYINLTMAYIELIERINEMFPDLKVTSSQFEQQNYLFLKDFLLRALLEVKVDVDNITKVQLSQPASDSSHMITAINLLCTIRRVYNIPKEDFGLIDILCPSSQTTVAIITKMMDYLEFADNRMVIAFEQSKRYTDASKEMSELHNKYDDLNEQLNEYSLKMSTTTDKKNKVIEDLDELQKSLDQLSVEKHSLELKLQDLKATEKSVEKIKYKEQKMLHQIICDIENIQKKVDNFSDEVVENLDILKEEAKSFNEQKDNVWNKVCEHKSANTSYQSYIQCLKPLHNITSEVFTLATSYECLLSEKTLLKNKDYQSELKEKETTVALLKEKLFSINKELLLQSENFKTIETEYSINIDSLNKEVELLMACIRELKTHIQGSMNTENRIKDDTNLLKSKYIENMKSYQLKYDSLKEKMDFLKKEGLLRKSKMEESLEVNLNFIRTMKEEVKRLPDKYI